MPASRLATAAFVAVVVPVLSSVLRAHGGQYIPPQIPLYGGPRDVVPPSGASPGPRTGRPSGPSTAGPSGPAAPAPGGPATGGAPAPASAPPRPLTGGPAGPSAPAPGVPAPRTGGRGSIAIQDDFTTWEYWWEFNKNPFLRLRRAVHASVQTGSDDFYLGATRRKGTDALEPTNVDKMVTVLPALKRALDATEQRDITTAAMIAMAKIGRDHRSFELLPVFRERLDENDQEVRETAALAIGIAAQASQESLALLAGLVRDDDVGRKASGGSVNARTRAFAAYALGLTALDCGRVEVKRQVFEVLQPIVLDKGMRDRNVKTAAIHGLGLLGIDGGGYAEQKLRSEALDALEKYFVADLGAGAEYAQAHCAIAMARLCEHGSKASLKRLLLGTLQARGSKRRGNVIAQGCVQALGRIADRCDDLDAPDAEISELLLQVSAKHRDAMTRRFALMALARIGGKVNREALLREFPKANKTQRRPWCALALGVLAYNARQDSGVAGVDAMIVETLRDELAEARQPDLVGALAVGLGLCGASDESDLLVQRLHADLAKEKMAGYLCIGLALMGDERVAGDVRSAMERARFRPLLLVQAAIALGKLGDKLAGEQLLERMRSKANLVTLASCAQALAQIGDRRSIEPLVATLLDDDLSALPRAFAAAALGGVCDRRALPWSTPISVDINYRANVPTLTDAKAGVLDIL